MNAENILEVRDLQTTFKLYEGMLRAVNHVDLTLRTGKTLGIIGESGCGKSVTAHSILNTVQAPGKVEGGTVMYRTREGKEVNLAAQGQNSKFIRSIRGKEISMIFQEPMTSMSPVYSIGQQMEEAYLTHLSRRPNRAMRQEAHDRAIEMLKRAMIAMALMNDPAILIADEPTTALDVTVQAQITDLMLELQERMNMSIIYITHDMGVISEVADDICVMYLGRVMEQGTAEQIFLHPQHPYTVRLLRSIPKLGRKIPGARLDAIQGNVPVPLDPKDECGFYSRCEEREAGVCDCAVPPFVEVEPGHLVRCVHCGKGAS